MSDYRRVALESDLSDGALKQVEIEGRQILLIRAEGRVFAIDAICNHAIGYLEDGDLEGFELFCPLHGGAFDIRTGAATTAKSRIAAKKKASTLLDKASTNLSKAIHHSTSALQDLLGKV